MDIGRAITQALRQQEERDFWRLVRETSESLDVADGLDPRALARDEQAAGALVTALAQLDAGDGFGATDASWVGVGGRIA